LAKEINFKIEDLDKDSLLKPEQIVGFDNVDGKASYLALAANFVDNIKQAYRQDKMAQEILIAKVVQ